MINPSVSDQNRHPVRPMRLALFGTTGAVGSRILAEALARSHKVTAGVRAPDSGAFPDVVDVRPADVTCEREVAELARGQDAIISATRPPGGQEQALVTMTRALLQGAARAGTRLVLVGGAASLTVPGTGGRAVIDDPAYCPPAAQPIARACMDQLSACRENSRADWTYLSPPALLKPGTRTERYRVGADTLVTDGAGHSTISMEDFAVALLDEVERPRHVGMRFTVAY